MHAGAGAGGKVRVEGADEKARAAWKAGAARALDRAERIRKVKREVLRPVVRDGFSDGGFLVWF